MTSTQDFTEINKFNQNANVWWDKNGPFKTLHDINNIRLEYILNNLAACGQIENGLVDKHILDIGCGGGILSEAMAKAGAKVTGLDAGEQTIAAAIEHCLESNLEISYVNEPLESYQPEQNFDVITCLEMLEHVPNPEIILQQAHRLLQDDGLLFLSTINKTLKAYLGVILGAEYLLKLLPRQTHDYQKFIKPGELAVLLQNTGFELLGIKGINYNPFSRKASLCADVSMNYLMVAKKID